MTEDEIAKLYDELVKSYDVWPEPKFWFQVEWPSAIATFREVSGLNIESQPIEYRHDNQPVFSAIKMPGIKKYGNITLKKGIFKSDNKLTDWLNGFKMNTLKREPLTIKLMDESGAPTMIWTLANAFITKITGENKDMNSNEIAIESIEIVHEGITISNS
jgi:phage tail-like protein